MTSINSFLAAALSVCGKQKSRLLSGGLLALTVASIMPAHADTAHDLAVASKKSNWSGYASLSGTRNIYDKSAFDSYRALNFDGLVAYRTSYGQYRVSFGGDKEFQHAKDQTFHNPFLEYRTPMYKLADQWSAKGSVGVYLPMNHYSKLDKLQYAPRVAGYLYYQPSDNWTLVFSPRYQYNAYKYKTGGGAVLIEHKLTALGEVTWEFTDNWAFDVSGSYGVTKDFRGHRADNFTVAEELSWTFKPSWVAAVGHNNSGQFLNPEQGPSQGFRLARKRSSTFYVSLTKYF